MSELARERECVCVCACVWVEGEQKRRLLSPRAKVAALLVVYHTQKAGRA